MPIPETQLFEAFLSKTRLVRDKLVTPAVQFTAKSAALVSEAPVLYLAYPEMELSFDSIIKVIERELNSSGCVADERIAIATLGLIVESRSAGASFVEHANRCLATTHLASLHLVTVLPSVPSRDYRIARAEYSIQTFDPRRVLYWAERGNAAYPIDLRALAGRLCIAREPLNATLVDWDRVPGCSQIVDTWGMDIALASVVDEYYQAVAEHYFSQLPGLIREDLVVYEGGALMHIAVDALLGSIFADRIGLFHWEGTSGHRSWALLGRQTVLHTNLYPMSLYSECKKWLESEFGFYELSDARPLHATIRTYSRFLQRAHKHRLSERRDEAFMHFVIALDLLLGLEGRSSESVCQRAALLVHQQLGNSFEAQVTILKRLYDRRSKYVHEGRPVSSDDLREAERICTEILWDLLAASGHKSCKNIGDWLKHIDFLIASTVAQRDISANDMDNVGIPRSGLTRRPPNRVAG